ncbi:hypothetical protein LZD49_33175 [Dyadobacter sp. CY261]|uniref:hypothetical protein n=1 Tax=Dyadobacter sp. CY261 TaxID=2907203 RepID=UPI001F17ED91|nr:hypothetical protein [Dyadobacter sp. CY261]MCF0075378.1 hypothetical protein [Dyadobacter sp. CY261]
MKMLSLLLVECEQVQPTHHQVMRKLVLVLFILQSLHLGEYAQAQSAPLGYLTVDADSSGSYWRVLTDAKARNTRVQFFGNDRTLLYEEEIPEKWVKQNKRNRRWLNRLLTDISANRLIVSRLKTEQLPAEPTRSAVPAPTGITDHGNAKDSYKVHVAINSEGKIRVAVNNPESLRYKIEIADYRDNIIYQEFTSIHQYRRHIDISPVMGDTAQLILSIDKRRFVYKIRREEKRSSYTVNPVIVLR